ALALLGGGVAGGDLSVGGNQVGAHGDVGVEALVAVEAVGLVVIGTEADLHLVEVVFGAGLLGDAVHGAAGGAAPGKGGARSLADFDLFNGKAFAGGHAGVAQAIDKDIAAGFMAADDIAVAKGIAVFTGAESDTGLGG